MADEENRTVETATIVPPVTAEETKSEKKELALLKLEVKKLLAEMSRLQNQLDASLKTPPTPDNGVIITKGSKLSLASGEHEVIDIDTSWEVGQKVEKSYVEEDALCLVLKKS